MGTGFLHGVARERLTAEQVAAAVGLLPVTGSGRVSVQSGHGGTAIGLADGPFQLADFRLAVITDAGPKGEDDGDNELYWTQAARPAGGPVGDNIAIRPDKANYPDDWWVPATNLAEWAANGGTHELPTDGSTLVLVLRLLDQADNERFIFYAPIVPVTFTARLDSSTQDGTNKRWTYDFTEVVKTGAGYGQWTTKPAGRTGTAYNRIEDANGASGLVGSGIDLDNLPAGFDLMPAPDGWPVLIEQVRRADDPTADPEYWFSFENSPDGTCS